MMREQISDIDPDLGFGPIVLDGDNTPAALDLRGADAASILLQVGVGGITFTTENKIKHSDDDSSYAAVGANDVILGKNADGQVGTGGIVKSLVAAHAAASVTQVAYIGGKRYLKILADFSGTHSTGTPICVRVIRDLLHLRPA